jgi:hypothetical protein
MPEKASNEPGYFVLSNAHYHQAVASMPKARQIKACIAGEEGDTTLPTQENDDLFVLQTLAANVDSNLPRRQPRGFQHQPLPIEDVLVENDQARTRSRTYSGAVYWEE